MHSEVNGRAPGATTDRGTFNWGRWGGDDERGAINTITPEIVVEAAGLVRCGQVIPLGSQVGKRGAVSGGRNKTWHVTTRVNSPEDPGRGRAEDILTMHTHAHSHIDGLGHIWYDGQFYNGMSADLVGRGGAKKGGIDKVGGIVTRGVLLDVTEGGSRQWDIGECISATELQAAADRAGMSPGAGAALMVRTGWFDRFLEKDASFFKGEPGFDRSAVEWVLDTDPALVGFDNFAGEPLPAPPGQNPLLVHEALLRDNGIFMIELLNLRELAAAGAAEFLFVGAPLLVANGLGSPINPLAVL
jgi:kynurenine formamidase